MNGSHPQTQKAATAFQDPVYQNGQSTTIQDDLESRLDDIAAAYLAEEYRYELRQAFGRWWVEQWAEDALRAEREQTRKRKADMRARLREEMVEAYGPCAKCGSTEDIQIDHIDGNGRQHRAEVGIDTGWKTYAYLRARDWPLVVDGYRLQPLCAPCHRAKSGLEAHLRAVST